jgi:predicted negative regulator of RcsB-dependent stress response
MNDFENQGFMRRNAVWLVVLVAIVIFGLLLFKGWDKVVNDQVDRTSTVTGNFSCLPLKTGAEPIEDCELGVKSNDGTYYALDISRIQDANTDLKAEDTIAVTGFVLPASAVVGSQWERYAVSGIIKVNTLLRTR